MADLDLARRAVASPGFRLRPGMRWRLGKQRPGSHDLGRTGGRVLDDGCLLTDAGAYVHDDGNVIPDLDDPATLGCLLALVREAWGCVALTVEPGDRMDPGAETLVWAHYDAGRVEDAGHGPTLAAALVDGLESAP